MDTNIVRKNTSAETDREVERALRPLSFGDFTGQEKTLSNLKVYVEAARQRTEPLDHTLLHGPPGLGKTTLSHILANEMNAGLKTTTGRCWISPVTWPVCLPICSQMMCCLLMKSID